MARLIVTLTLHALPSLGPGNSFVDIYKGNENSVTIDKSAANLPIGKQVQFRVSAVNVIGEGLWSFPYGIKIPD